MSFESFLQQVSDELECKYGISWDTASGEREPLERALTDGETPTEFVERFGKKYDLIPLSNPWGRNAIEDPITTRLK